MTDKQLVVLMAKTAGEILDNFEEVAPDASEEEKLKLALPIKLFTDMITERMVNPRGFKRCEGYKDAKIPVRATVASAGYDFFAYNTAIIPAGKKVKFHTGIKAYMNPWEVLKIYPRSSMGIKYNLVLANGVAIIDSDYYNNKDNEGEIIICLYNFGSIDVKVTKGERIAQGIFESFESALDVPTKRRTGGIGSTGE